MCSLLDLSPSLEGKHHSHMNSLSLSFQFPVAQSINLKRMHIIKITCLYLFYLYKPYWWNQSWAQ